jgi:hypothetical protein
MFAKSIAALVLLGSVSLAQGPVLSLAIDNATALGGGALEITAGGDWRMHITALKPLVHVETWAIFHTLDHQPIPWIFTRLRNDPVQGNIVFTQTFTLPSCSVDVGLQLACVGTLADGTQILLTRELSILAGTGDL